MKLLIGTYRKRAYIERALTSLDQHLDGHTAIEFVDDSGDNDHCDWLQQYGTVHRVGGRGYAAAMTTVCQIANNQDAMFWEEDFTLLQPVNLNDLAEILWNRPYLAQVALLRNAWFPIEHQHGGLLEALVAKGHRINYVNGVHEQTATFTCNPALWRGSVYASGWPNVKWSEEAKRDQLLSQGYRFGFLEGVKVDHDGERTGHSY